MRSLPLLDVKTSINHSPHVVILGAGASLAAFPNGDSSGKRLPLMRNLVEVIGLQPLLAEYGVTTDLDNFESLYDGLVESQANSELLYQLEYRIRDYFSSMRIAPEVTIYDLLLLSLREKDVIATFNWDPFLAQAFRRNMEATDKLPRILFLHGNVEIGVCDKHRRKGFINQQCGICGAKLQPTRLLFPVKHKDYTSDPFIKGEWEDLQSFMGMAYLVTIFGYSAPVTDVEAKALLLDKWRENPTQELAQIDVVDIRSREEVEATWLDFFVRQNYAIQTEIHTTHSFLYVRRSCDAFAMATLQQRPWSENPFPNTTDLKELHAWIQPLISEEVDQKFSGKPC